MQASLAGTLGHFPAPSPLPSLRLEVNTDLKEYLSYVMEPFDNWMTNSNQKIREKIFIWCESPMKKNAISMNGEVDESVKGDDDHGQAWALNERATT